MSSAITICNAALANLGDSASISSIDPPDGSAQADHCAMFYPMARDMLLETYQWSWMTRRAQLALLSASPLFGWDYAYALPARCKIVVEVRPADMPNETILNQPNITPFLVETMEDGTRAILTNAVDAVARYTVQVDDPNLYSTTFCTALSWQLSSMIAGPMLRGDTGIQEAKRCAQMAQVYLELAKAKDAKTGHVRPTFTPSSVLARQ